MYLNTFVSVQLFFFFSAIQGHWSRVEDYLHASIVR